MDEDMIDCKYAVINRIGCLVDEFQIDVVAIYFTNTGYYNSLVVNLEFMFSNKKHKIEYNFKEDGFSHDLREFSFIVENYIIELENS